MMKLGSDWHAPQKAHGKKRIPIEVAKNLEKEFIDTAQRLLENKTPFGVNRRAAKPAHDDDAAHGHAAANCHKAARVIHGKTPHHVVQPPDSHRHT